jgi:hypothetical protein
MLATHASGRQAARSNSRARQEFPARKTRAVRRIRPAMNLARYASFFAMKKNINEIVGSTHQEHPNLLF